MVMGQGWVWGGPVKTESELRQDGFQVLLKLVRGAVAKSGVAAVGVEAGVEVVALVKSLVQKLNGAPPNGAALH